MISFIKRFFSSQSQPTIDIQPKTKEFKFLIIGKYEHIPQKTWYRKSNWRDTYFLRMETEWSKDWKNFSTEEPVVGVSKEDRTEKFIILGDQADFRIYLEREPNNMYDKNAIKVMGSATVVGEYITEQLGYLSKETAELLKDEKELDARPYSVYLPCEDRSYGLRIRVLIRSQAYKKKKEEITNKPLERDAK